MEKVTKATGKHRVIHDKIKANGKDMSGNAWSLGLGEQRKDSSIYNTRIRITSF